MGRPTMYSPEVRERAVRMVSEHRVEYPSGRRGEGLVYGGARVGVRLVVGGVDEDAGVALGRGWPFSVVGLSVARRGVESSGLFGGTVQSGEMDGWL